MIIRVRLQKRVKENIEMIKGIRFPGMRVTDGYVIGSLLDDYKVLISDKSILRDAYNESEIRNYGQPNPASINLKADAITNLECMQKELENFFGRSFYPAQIIDILAILSTKILLNEKKEENGFPVFSDRELLQKCIDVIMLNEKKYETVKRKLNELFYLNNI